LYRPLPNWTVAAFALAKSTTKLSAATKNANGRITDMSSNFIVHATKLPA
jgi:hypothetical protein